MKRLLAAKAEAVMGALLVLRHRTSRIAGLFALLVVGGFLIVGRNDTTHPQFARGMLVVVGMLASVVGSRLLAPGAALSSARRVAAARWLVPLGRLTGCLAVLFPGIAAATLVGNGSGWSIQLGVVSSAYAATVIALMLIATPIVGATLAASLSIAATIVGSISPEIIATTLNTWPRVQAAVVQIWQILPTPWLASQIVVEGRLLEVCVLGFWLVMGAYCAGFVVQATPFPRKNIGL